MWARFMTWVDRRFPATETFEYHMSKYYAPKNFNFWYAFGVIALVVLVLQLLTGIWLTMSYVRRRRCVRIGQNYMRDVEFRLLRCTNRCIGFFSSSICTIRG
jgi:ubiquinol-cytochrome c reductase cytochrome b subunit